MGNIMKIVNGGGKSQKTNGTNKTNKTRETSKKKEIIGKGAAPNAASGKGAAPNAASGKGAAPNAANGKRKSSTHEAMFEYKKGEKLLTVEQVSKWFEVSGKRVDVLRDIDLQVELGEFVVIFGPSGCGKSTLLHVLLGLEEPSEGKVAYLGDDFYGGTTQDDRSEVRKKHLGMVYQQSYWIKALNVEENVAFPLWLLGYDKMDAVNRARELLAEVELGDWAGYVPTELSGGQQQRIALARALICNPKVIVADEPTGNLDYQSGEQVMTLLSKLNKERGITVVMVTHDLEYVKYADRVVRMFDGEMVEEYSKAQIKKLLDKIHKDRSELGILGGKKTKNV